MKTDLNAAQRSFVLASLLLLGGLPAGADWLVTRPGGRVETRGTWQVKGKLVVFTQANGALSSLRLADLDLEASQQATAEAIQAEAAAAEEAPRRERKKSIRSLTDDDFGHSAEPAGPAAKPADGADAGKPGKEAGKETHDAVAVSSWRQAVRTEGDGLDLFGTLQNTGGELATDIAVQVELFNDAKESVATAVAILGSSSIPAGGSTTFRVPFEGVFTFASAKFQVSSKSLTLDVAPDDAGHSR